ncbi:hypothetical protein [Prevotella falsenii]|uniref:hypothetical protein n=1 Tax=Prevotella falsenii TaxID=515414 RepID=UPI0012EB4B64|nr:hypothetical protein [Prevotella falsenii]
MLLPSCFLTAFVRLPADVQPLHLAVARYAFDEMPAQLLNNRTKSVKNSRFQGVVTTKNGCTQTACLVHPPLCMSF